jgi:hypothetical protein
VEGLSLTAAEEVAQRCIDACNLVLSDGDASELAAMMAPDAVVVLSRDTTEVLTGPDELAERLLPEVRRGGMALLDVTTDGPDVVAGVAWADQAFVRAAEVRLMLDGDRITRIEWVQ